MRLQRQRLRCLNCFVPKRTEESLRFALYQGNFLPIDNKLYVSFKLCCSDTNATEIELITFQYNWKDRIYF